MLICFTSDTHGETPKIPKCDIFIHCGDLCPVVSTHPPSNLEIEVGFQSWWLDVKLRKWLGEIDADQKIFVNGNHDFIFQHSPNSVPKLPCNFLLDETLKINDINIWGTPWQPTHGNWGFNLAEDKLKEKYDLIPMDTDILISHGPPRGLGDINAKHERCGSVALKSKLSSMKEKRMIVSFGHIHDAYGSYKFGNIVLLNCSYMDRGNSPMLVDYNVKNKEFKVI